MGSNARKYTAEITCSENKVETKVYLNDSNEDMGDIKILIGTDYYYGEPETEQLIRRIKFRVKTYEEKSTGYPLLNEWDGNVY